MLSLILKTSLAIFGVMDPVGNVPIFLTLTEKEPLAAARSLAWRAVVRAGAILVVFAFLGNGILTAFHVSIESFRIAGGVILALLGLQIVFGLESHGGLHGERLRAGEAGEQDISVVPLATPLIAGPGTITAVVILAKEFGYAATLAGIALNLMLSLLLFHFAGHVLKVLGRKGTLIFAKVMGLILVAIGVEFVRSAI